MIDVYGDLSLTVVCGGEGCESGECFQLQS